MQWKLYFGLPVNNVWLSKKKTFFFFGYTHTKVKRYTTHMRIINIFFFKKIYFLFQAILYYAIYTLQFIHYTHMYAYPPIYNIFFYKSFIKKKLTLLLKIAPAVVQLPNELTNHRKWEFYVLDFSVNRYFFQRKQFQRLVYDIGRYVWRKNDEFNVKLFT